MGSLYANGIQCPFGCEAFHWLEECNVSNDKAYCLCCQRGTILLPFLGEPTKLMQEYYTGTTAKAKFYKQKTRLVNTILQFASTSFKERQQSNSYGPPTVIIAGDIQHRIGSLIPSPTTMSKYMQIYFYQEGDNQNAFFELKPPEVKTFPIIS